MNNLEQLIAKKKSDFNENEQLIAEYLLKFQKDIPQSKIVDLSKLCYTSSASLQRLIKKLGFEGFSEFKFFMRQEKETDDSRKFALQSNYLENLTKDIDLTIKMNQGSIIEAAKMIQEADCVYGYGTGWKQRQVLKSFNHDLLYYNKKTISLRNVGDFRILANLVTDNELVIITSLSGNTEQFTDVLEILKLKKKKIITVTCNQSNELVSYGDCSLFYEDDPVFHNKHWNCITLNTVMDYLLETFYTII